MRRRRRRGTWWFLASVWLLAAPAAFAEDDVLVLRCEKYVDVEALALRGPASIVIEGERIQAVEAAEAPVPEISRVAVWAADPSL